MRKSFQVWIPIVLVCLVAVGASAQSFRVQCPTSTVTHPGNLTDVNSEPPYNGPTQLPFFSITSISVSGTTATATVAGTLPTLTSAITATIQNVTPVGFNGVFPITIVPPNQFTYTLPVTATGLVYVSGSIR